VENIPLIISDPFTQLRTPQLREKTNLVRPTDQMAKERQMHLQVKRFPHLHGDLGARWYAVKLQKLSKRFDHLFFGDNRTCHLFQYKKIGTLVMSIN
jgi:hypothetical protein